MPESDLKISEDFDYLLNFLPQGWQEKAKELKALRRCRKMPNAQTLLRVLLIHLAEGCSLRETSVRASQGNLIDISDVAIMDRLKLAAEWFRWMNTEIMKQWLTRQSPTVFGSRWNVRLIDGTYIKEPGPTGSSWRIHYSINLPSLRCDDLIVSDSRGKGNGESFCRFAIKTGDLLVGDRVYGVRTGIFHAANNDGDVLTRFAMSNLPLKTEKNKPFDLLARLRRLSARKIGDWPVLIEQAGQTLKGRVCAIKKSRQAAEKARSKIIKEAKRNGTKTKPETVEAAGYVFVFTTVALNHLSPGKALEMYRGRWQIELVFKRLKSIVGLGHLRKSDKQAAVSWIQGKLLVAFLIEALIKHGESFFPWGFPLCEDQGAQSLSLARGAIHAESR